MPVVNLFLFVLATTVFGAPCLEEPTTTDPVIYMAGDSTMARGGGGGGTDGWGQFLGYSMSLSVVNKAMAGRSARSYTREGRFADIANTVKKGDYVIVEFGHNDGGSLQPTDDGRSDCPGLDKETCKTTYNGEAETVLTFPAYLENAVKTITSKGASVILSSQTPINPDQSGTFSYIPSRFVGYAQLVANQTDTIFVDHGKYVAEAYKSIAAVAKVDQLFPMDHTHTSPVGADIVATAFVKGLICGSSPLKEHVKNATVAGNCLQ